MFTVNIKTKQKQSDGRFHVVREAITEADSVHHLTREFQYSDGTLPEAAGIQVITGDNISHIGPRDDSQFYDVFVMNDSGATVARYVV